MYILLDADNIVLEIIPDEDPVFPGVPVSDRYAPDFVARLTQVEDDPSAQPGKMYLDGVFVDPPAPSVDPPPETLPEYLEQAKAQRIAQAETDLEAYLEAHPITWTDGHTYGITATQQAQLTSKIAVAQAKATLSAPYDLTWNATDGACTSWELADLLALAFAIDGRVTALESYKQDKVLEIKAAETVEALAAVVVDYDSVPLA